MSTDFDNHAANYSGEINAKISSFGQEHDFYIRRKARLLNELIRQVPSGKARVLDVGCAVGLIHPHLKGWSTLDGVDIAAATLDVARAANPGVTYKSYDGHVLPYESGQFDLTFVMCVLHHVPVPQWPDLIVELCRVTKPGGVVAILEHNPYNPLTNYIVRTCPLDEGVTLLKSDRSRELLQHAGCTDIETRYLLFTPIDNGFFETFDDMLGWLPLGAQYMVTGRVPPRG